MRLILLLFESMIWDFGRSFFRKHSIYRFLGQLEKLQRTHIADTLIQLRRMQRTLPTSILTEAGMRHQSELGPGQIIVAVSLVIPWLIGRQPVILLWRLLCESAVFTSCLWEIQISINLIHLQNHIAETHKRDRLLMVSAKQLSSRKSIFETMDAGDKNRGPLGQICPFDGNFCLDLRRVIPYS